jgi:hypothetical protein
LQTARSAIRTERSATGPLWVPRAVVALPIPLPAQPLPDTSSSRRTMARGMLARGRVRRLFPT